MKKIQTHLKVDFIFQSQSSAIQPQSPSQIILNQEEFINVLSASTIDRDWIQKLHYAAIQLDEELMLEIIEEITSDYKTLAQTLTQWVDNFNFDLIADATEQFILNNK